MSITPALYIVRKHDKQKEWELPTYYHVHAHAPTWLDGTFIHADAAILRHAEAKEVVARFPGSVMLRVG